MVAKFVNNPSTHLLSLRGCLESIKQVIFILGNGEQGTPEQGTGNTGRTGKDWEGLGRIGKDWGTHKKQ
jgi:hypothetical protein